MEPSHTSTTEITVGEKYTITADVQHSQLSLVQVRILCGLVFATRYGHQYSIIPDHRHLVVSVVGTVLTTSVYQHQGPKTSFNWEGDLIKCVDSRTAMDRLNDDIINVEKEYDYTVSGREGHVVLHCPEDGEGYVVTATFKDGELESIGDEPAVVVCPQYSEGSVYDCRLWFQHNKCYRAANPHLPSQHHEGYWSHHNSEGNIYRDKAVGLARYIRRETHHGFFVELGREEDFEERDEICI